MKITNLPEFKSFEEIKETVKAAEQSLIANEKKARALAGELQNLKAIPVSSDEVIKTFRERLDESRLNLQAAMLDEVSEVAFCRTKPKRGDAILSLLQSSKRQYAGEYEALALAASAIIMGAATEAAKAVCGNSKVTYSERDRKMGDIDKQMISISSDNESHMSIIRRLAEMQSWTPVFSE